MRALGFHSESSVKPRYNPYRGELNKKVDNLSERHCGVDTPDTVFVSNLTEFRLENSTLSVLPDHGSFRSQHPGVHYGHITEHDAVQSMSRKGNCYDNAVMENFFGHLKSEMFYGEHFTSLDHLRSEIDSYIHWYNTKRRQKRLKGMTPMQYRCHTLAAYT